MAEVLRAEAKTAGSNQRICRLRISTAAPPTPGPGPQARRSLVTFHRWKVTRRRQDQKTNRRESRGRSKGEQSPPYFSKTSNLPHIGGKGTAPPKTSPERTSRLGLSSRRTCIESPLLTAAATVSPPSVREKAKTLPCA